jgi:hypothetical protein
MPKGVQWDQNDEAELARLAGEGLSLRQIAEATGKTYHQVKNKAQAMGVRTKGGVAPPTLTRVVSETPERVVVAPEESDEEPFDELLERAKRATTREVRKAAARRFCAAKIVTGKPVAIVFASDQHLTMHGPCDVERAFSDAEAIQQTPGMFALLGGDGVDNHIKHRAALVSKASRPTDEYRLYDGYLRTLGHKTLAVISGNHDDWTKDAAGVDMVGVLAARNRLHYASDVVVMTVKLVASPDDDEGQEYTIKLRHQYRFGSSLNLLHTVKRMYDMDGDQFDIGVVCHNHEAEVGTFNRHGTVRYGIRPGSYQLESAWSRRIGFGQSYPTCPGVVLWPGERRIELFEDLRGLTEKLNDARRPTDRAA